LGALSKGPNSLIQNVAYLGGAINFKGLGKEQKWRKIMGQTIAADIANIFSTKDYILLGYSLTHEGKGSAGRNYLPFEDEIFKLRAEKEVSIYSCEILRFKNRNITRMVDAADAGQLVQNKQGHLNYRSELKKIMLMIDHF